MPWWFLFIKNILVFSRASFIAEVLHDFWHHQPPCALVQCQFLTVFIVNIFADHYLDLPGSNSRLAEWERRMGVYHHLDTIEQQIGLKKTVLNIIDKFLLRILSWWMVVALVTRSVSLTTQLSLLFFLSLIQSNELIIGGDFPCYIYVEDRIF